LTTLLWLYLPELRFVQFPFRFLSVIGVVLPLVVFGNGIAPKLTKTACGLMAALAMLPPLFYMRIAPVASSALPSYAAYLRQGYPGTDEYTPTGAVTQNSPATLAPVIADSPSDVLRCSVTSLPGGARLKNISVDTDGVCRVRFDTYFYPYWEAADETGGKLLTSRDDAGLLIVEVPKGQHTVHVRFHVYSVVRMISMAVSLAVFLCFFFEVWRYLRSGTREPQIDSVSGLGREVTISGIPTAKGTS
jgi:hypothetical protein